MAAENTLSSRGASLEELIALTDEMAALVRAGIPLEEGLTHVARDLARRPGRIAQMLATRMQGGESLLHVVSTSPDVFPPTYRAVVEAGLRCGRLPAALEGLASTARRASELGKLSRMAILYPVFIALLAYGLFVASLIWFQPMIRQAYATMDKSPSSINLALIKLGQIAPAWFALIPVLGIAALGIWWYRSSRAIAKASAWQRLTPVGRMIYYGRMSTFADMMALMIENGTDLKRAVVLAADASGDRLLQSSAEDVAMDIERGLTRSQEQNRFGVENQAVSGEAAAPESSRQSASVVQQDRPAKGRLPPLVNWMLVAGATQSALAEGLRSTAATYRRRAMRMDHWLRSYLPMGLTVIIGGTTVALYAIGMLGPWYEMLKNIAAPR